MHTRAEPLYFRSPWYFTLLLLVAVVGFFPSYFSRLGEAKALHHFHALTATAWLLLLITQGYLMRTRRLALHRALGRTSLVIVPLFLVSGLFIVHDMLTRDSGFARRFGPRLSFVDLSTLAWFAFAYVMALRYRKAMALHARFMVSTALPLLPPALARALATWVPGVNSFDLAFHLSYLGAELVTVALLLHDRQSGKMRAPFLLLLALLLVQQASYHYAMEFGPWRALVAWIQAL